MQSYRAHKIDLNQDYPCPCRCRGRLHPIILTEALGCARCQQIFVLGDEGRTLEKLVTHYPYKQAWRWTGQQWYRAYRGWGSYFFPLALSIVCLLLFFWLPIARALAGSVLLLAAIALALAMLPALLIWLLSRR